MLGHLRRSLRALHGLPITGRAACRPVPLHQFWSSHIQSISGSGWCNKHAARDFSTSKNMTSGGVYLQKELESTKPMKDTDIIINRIQKSTRELEQGPIGKNLSSEEKRKFLFNTLLGLEDSREAVYSTLDAWVAFEQDFPLASLKQALSVLEKEGQWHRIIQVIKWMLSKGQGNTMNTYELLVRALEKDNRAEEAHIMWQKKTSHDLHSVPWRFCHHMLSIYYRNNMLDRLVKLFKDLEACGRKPRSKDIIRKVGDAYEMQGKLEEKIVLLENYKDLYSKPSRDYRKKGSKSKKTQMNKTDGVLRVLGQSCDEPNDG
ncbi:hypothetical protein SEVIR_5G129800v4 [Setaria viridis]|uniref:Pentacotripeptide-repeat region of PRORP domain-containing protein n=1 Tax=Setaria viridis TaxID=4556 RepID=A0A4U6UDB9_SETVI|nr:pentatricopeptide repeat-containing protein At4g18975, chloroplastic-like isoform X1 [Setaria viridis]TKW13868.1 hypothetical protein SEVIR_5G129800v2 [Setaria viridis]